MPSATQRRPDRTHDDGAARMARRIERELRLHAQRRRAVLLVTSAATLALLLLVGGLTVAMARGDRSAGADAGPARPVSSVATQTVAANRTADASAQIAPARKSSEKTATPSKPAANPVPAAAPAAKQTPAKPKAPARKAPSATASGSNLLVQKCSGSRCHSASEVSGGGLDRESAVGGVRAMLDNGYLKLTPSEFEAVITALTR